ncbi:MAG: 1-acyl-sn-glycerol-3-phosphate acyltransferase [Sphingobacteriia bacterium]|nr:1-acyl-sn-glycerol-3-phosphate acyltransferase [Sphingobacteriia bacterium]
MPRYIYTTYALIAFVLIMLVLLPFVIIASFFGINGGNFIYKLCNIWGSIWYFFVGIWHKEIYEVPHTTQKPLIFVANHISYLDIPAIVKGIHQPYRALGKYEMVKIPVFGWIYRSAVILVDRSSHEKRARSVRALKAALAKDISILLFPEGTFNETGKPLKFFYDGAFRIAIETQTNIKPLILPDTVNRLHYTNIFSLTPGINRVIYLEEISVQGYTLKDIEQLKETVFAAMQKALLKYGSW